MRRTINWRARGHGTQPGTERWRKQYHKQPEQHEVALRQMLSYPAAIIAPGDHAVINDEVNEVAMMT
ncbi:MAG TPA: hypothetical protein DCP03_18350 [Polaromonas sp.]|uniref:hypothetical protein n=1 Tax=Polaromonas sp. UBA4122 TaxID=1947074 RepID=UPI000ED33E2C|nr:hypothetical protein [Polaromonas sp. UBA4122]HAL39955.1 hypothetical protein [Polaromonas sp.]